MSEIDALKKDVQQLRKDLKELLAGIGQEGKGRMDGAKMRVWETANEWGGRAGARMHGAYDSVSERGKDALGRTREEIEDRPLMVIVGAFVVGLIVGALMHRGD